MLDLEFDKATNIRRTFALEFTESTIRLLQFEERSSKGWVRAFSEVEVPAGTIENFQIMNPQAAGDALVKALAESEPGHVATSYTICLIPQQLVFLTTIDVAVMPKKELAELMKRKIQDVIPMAEAEVYWDWHRLETINNNYRIQLVAAPRALIDSYMATLAHAKIVPLLFEPSAIAAGRVVMYTEPARGDSRDVLIEVTDKNYILSLLLNGHAVFSTEVPLQSDMHEYNLKQLVVKITEINNYFGGKADENLEVWMYGEPEEVTRLHMELPKLVSYKVSTIGYTRNKVQIMEFLTKKKINDYVSLIGAAIKGLAKGNQEMSSLNLVPQKAKEAYSKKELLYMLRKYLSFLAIDVVALVILMLVVSNIFYERVNSIKERYDAIINFSNSEKITTIENSINKLNSSVTEVRSLTSNLYDWQKLFDHFNSLTPAAVTIHTLTMQPNTDGLTVWDIGITGTATDRSSVINFLDNLENSKFFIEVKLPLESLENGQNVNFTIEAKLPFKNLQDETLGAN